MLDFEKIKQRWKTGSKKLSKKPISEKLFDIHQRKYYAYYRLNEFDLFLLRPNIVDNKIKDIKINDTYYRILQITGYPSEVSHGFIDELIRSDVNFDIVEYIIPLKRSEEVAKLERSLTNTRLELYDVKERGQFSASLDFKEQSQLTAMRKLTRGEQKAFSLGIGVAVKSNTKEELELETKKVQDVLDGLSIDSKVLDYYQEDGLRSFLPNNDFYVKTKDMLTGGVSAFFPFTESFLETDKQGIILGVNQNTNIPIIMDIFKLPNPNGVILGTSGSGKSFTIKSIATRYAQRGYSLFIIDPNNEYEFMVRVLGGQYIRLSPTSQSMINPLDLMGHKRDNKIEILKVFINILIPSMTDQQWGVFRDSCEMVYEDFGITRDFDYMQEPDKEMPTLEDVYNKIRNRINDIQVNQKKSPPIEFVKLLNHIKPFAKGAYDYLSKKTSINWTGDIICFGIEGMPDTVSGSLMFLILDLIDTKMREFKEKKNLKDLQSQFKGVSNLKELKKLKQKLNEEQVVRGFIIVDEAWLVLDRAGGDYIKKFAKVIRKYGLSIQVISQEARDLESSDGGKAMLANSSFNLILAQKPNQIPEVSRIFNLSNEEERHIETSGKGEGILITDREHFKYKSILTKDEMFIAESDFAKRIELDIQNLTALNSLYNTLIESGLEQIEQEEKEEFLKFRRKENKSEQERNNFKIFQDKILNLGKEHNAYELILEYDKLNYIYGQDVQKQLQDKKELISKPIETISIDVLKSEKNYYLFDSLNDDELIELENQGFAKISIQIAKHRKISFMMRLHEFKNRKKLIPIKTIEQFEVPKLRAKYLHQYPAEIDHLHTYYHQSLCYLCDYLIKEQGIKDVEIENEKIEDRPDIYWINHNGVECVIEVESGARQYEIEGLLTKKKRFTNTYADRWYILVPSQEIQRHYEKALDMKGRVIIKTELEKTINILNHKDIEQSSIKTDVNTLDT